jgi:hypothetical protein
VRNNYLHHIYGRAGEGANGVYLDDNFSSATIENNIFEAQVRPIHLGGGRDHKVLNNLFVDCFRALHIDARGLGWRTYGFDELKQKLELWPYTKVPWSTRYPALLTLLSDEPMAPKNVLVARNIIVDSTWDDIEGKAQTLCDDAEQPAGSHTCCAAKDIRRATGEPCAPGRQSNGFQADCL